MHMSEPAFTLGVEEEYLLVDLESRDLVSDPPAELMRECTRLLQAHVSPELMRAQIEVGTPVCHTLGDVRESLKWLRGTIAEVSNRFGCAPIAVSTHPFARWLEQKQTAKQRYLQLTDQMQAAARRLLICGMHVHVGIEDEELRIDLMNQMSYFLPHLLAMSSSSPFWEGEDTGLRSYRLTVFDALPRTGLPEQFASYAEYERHVRVLVNAGLVEDASMIWWDLRPSASFPTLETRIMDVVTNLEHTLSLVALTVCLTRMLYRARIKNQRWRVYAGMLINENRWRAMRYSFDEGLIDLAKGEVVPFPELLDELMAFIEEDADYLGCQDEIMGLRDILANGTSAHNQITQYQKALDQGVSNEEALSRVVDWLIDQTVKDL